MGLNPKNYLAESLKGHIFLFILLWLALSAILALWNRQNLKPEFPQRFSHFLLNYKVLIGAAAVYLFIVLLRFLVFMILLIILFNYILAFAMSFFVSIFTDSSFSVIYKYWFGHLVTIVIALILSLAVRFVLKCPKSIPFKV